MKNKVMKRVAIVLVSMVVAASLAGCGSSTPKATSFVDETNAKSLELRKVPTGKTISTEEVVEMLNKDNNSGTWEFNRLRGAFVFSERKKGDIAAIVKRYAKKGLTAGLDYRWSEVVSSSTQLAHDIERATGKKYFVEIENPHNKALRLLCVNSYKMTTNALAD